MVARIHFDDTLAAEMWFTFGFPREADDSLQAFTKLEEFLNTLRPSHRSLVRDDLHRLGLRLGTASIVGDE